MRTTSPRLSLVLRCSRIAIVRVAAALTLPAAYAGVFTEKLVPKITEQPRPLSVTQGEVATFTVAIEKDKNADQSPNAYQTTYGTPVFQWLKNGSRITGATSSTLTISNAQPADAGSYTVVVTNDVGWVASSAATLTVIVPVPATILTHPVSATVTSGQSVTFSVTALGTPAPTYRWRKNGVPIAGATSATLTLTAVDSGDAGSYDVLVTNSRASLFSRTALLRVTSSQPEVANDLDAAARISGSGSLQTLHLQPGEPATFTAANEADETTFQWKRDGVVLPGATAASLVIASTVPADMGFYSVTTTRDGVSREILRGMLTVQSRGRSALTNISTRGFVPAGGALTPGFTLHGTGNARLLVRAVGPTLQRFGVSEAHRDPALDLIRAGTSTVMLANDDWAAAPGALDTLSLTAAVGAFGLDTSARDAAVVATLPSGQSYTARIHGKDSAAGVVLAEIYDGGDSKDAVRLAAVSTLGLAGQGDRALVAGVTISGDAPKRLLIRAVGPGLGQFAVAGALADPRLTVVPAGYAVPVASNDNWDSDAAIITAAASVGAFALERGSADAAVIVTLPPGGYTVSVAGADGATGTALLELYDLDR